jgi:hypothetical protein
VIGSNAGSGRLAINSVGEGSIWVCEANGPVLNGDYLTTSDADGYAMKQGEEYIANYTVAKATMDCDFSAPQLPALKARRVFRASKAFRVLPAHKEQLVRRVPQERKVHREIKARPALKAHRVFKA